MKFVSAIASLGFTAAASAATVTLYNGSLGTSPETQGYLSYYSLPAGGVKSTTATATSYDSTADFSIHGGFSNDTIFGAPVSGAFPPLINATGYTIDLSLQKLSENHGTDNDRSATSLIVLGSNHIGIELEFWNNEVWAQSGADFVHAEGVAFNTAAANNAYSLSVSGTTYTLSINGTPSLTGNLRDYSGNGIPYTLNNYLFLGDNTGSAAGAFTFSSLSVTTPEPASLGLIAVTGLSACRRRPIRLA